MVCRVGVLTSDERLGIEVGALVILERHGHGHVLIGARDGLEGYV